MHKIAFIGFRHSHILGLYEFVQKSPAFTVTGACEENAAAVEALRRLSEIAPMVVVGGNHDKKRARRSF